MKSLLLFATSLFLACGTLDLHRAYNFHDEAVRALNQHGDDLYGNERLLLQYRDMLLRSAEYSKKYQKRHPDRLDAFAVFLDTLLLYAATGEADRPLAVFVADKAFERVAVGAGSYQARFCYLLVKGMVGGRLVNLRYYETAKRCSYSALDTLEGYERLELFDLMETLEYLHTPKPSTPAVPFEETTAPTATGFLQPAPHGGRLFCLGGFATISL